MFIRAPYNYDTDAASVASGVMCDVDGDMAQQQFKEDSDINTIVKRFGLTGEMPENFSMPSSGDFTGISDFHSAMNVVRESQEAFMQIPAELRYRFANDPGRLMEFLADDRNRDEAVKLGLVNKPPEVPRDVVTAIDEMAARLPPLEK